MLAKGLRNCLGQAMHIRIGLTVFVAFHCREEEIKHMSQYIKQQEP